LIKVQYALAEQLTQYNTNKFKLFIFKFERRQIWDTLKNVPLGIQ